MAALALKSRNMDRLRVSPECVDHRLEHLRMNDRMIAWSQQPPVIGAPRRDILQCSRDIESADIVRKMRCRREFRRR